MRSRTIWAAACSFSLLTVATTGRELPAADVTKAQPPTVAVSLPVQRQIIDYDDCSDSLIVGAARPAQSVKIVPRATGYLKPAPSKEGLEVKRGDVLFEIDPRSYQYQLELAQRKLDLEQARLKKATSDYLRAKERAKAPGTVDQLDLDNWQAAEDVAVASVDVAKANVEECKANLGYCHVTSPIDGFVGRYDLAPGNVAIENQTALATVTSLDSMHVDFWIKDQTLQRLRGVDKNGRTKPTKENGFTILVGLYRGKGYPYQGTIDFIDSDVHPDDLCPGTHARAVVENPKSNDGVRPLAPGTQVQIRIPLGKPHAALFVARRAIVGSVYPGSVECDLFVVRADGTVERRRVGIGVQEDGMVEICSGLKAGEVVAIDGIEQLQPNLKIRPTVVPMPIAGEE